MLRTYWVNYRCWFLLLRVEGKILSCFILNIYLGLIVFIYSCRRIRMETACFICLQTIFLRIRVCQSLKIRDIRWKLLRERKLNCNCSSVMMPFISSGRSVSHDVNTAIPLFAKGKYCLQ